MTEYFTKLFSSIVHSTVWQESKETKIVWVTMLALADRHGVVSASIPGLAKVAGVTVPECEEALAKFLAPDKYSRSKEAEGRRIVEVRGGWSLINHAQYRELSSPDDLREKWARNKRAQRERKRQEKSPPGTGGQVSKVSTVLPIAEADTDQIREIHAVAVVSPAQGGQDSGEQQQQQQQQQQQPPTDSRAQPELEITCPKGLRLLPDQRGALETSMIPAWALDALELKHRTKALGKPSLRMTAEQWQSWLAVCVTSDWNDPKKRPKPPESDENVCEMDRKLANAERA